MTDRKTIKSEIILPQIKHNIFNLIKNTVFERNGVVFGGMVRNSIISDHYKKNYYKYSKENNLKNSNKRFWDASYHPETALRTLVADDIDISFETSMESADFISDMMTMCYDEKVSIDIEDMSSSSKYGVDISVKKMTLHINVGKIPFSFEGYDFDITIDIVVPDNKNIQPPFKNLDLLCNGFIMTKYGMMFSKFTGTKIDNMSELDRIIASKDIIKDMINLKTKFCWMEKKKQKNGLKYNSHAFKRIEKLLNNGTPWIVTNLPFKMEKVIENDMCDECCICSSNFEMNEIKSFIVSSNDIDCCKMHTKCFFKYMEYQLKYMYENSDCCDSQEFTFKCPLRTTIDFSKSK